MKKNEEKNKEKEEKRWGVVSGLWVLGGVVVGENGLGLLLELLLELLLVLLLELELLELELLELELLELELLLL